MIDALTTAISFLIVAAFLFLTILVLRDGFLLPAVVSPVPSSSSLEGAGK